MISKNIFKIAAFSLLGAVIFSCAKEQSPTLTITVVDDRGAPAKGAIVHAWPGNNSAGGTINETEMDKTGTTDASGQVVFEFKFSAVLDVDVIHYRSRQVLVDTLMVTVTDTLSAHKVVKIESVRQRSSDNDYKETITLK